MSEKGDLPQDTDSLPPNYASSEVFTDSPPPAYRKSTTVRLQITRVICFTLLAAGFLIGAFVLAHTWITNKTVCDCPTAPNSPFIHDASFSEASSLPLVGNREAEENFNQLDSSQLDQESRQLDIPLPLEEEIEPEEDPIEVAEEVLEEEEENLQSLVQEVQKNAKMPLDLIMGNPQLAGKDVQCKVEKKMQHLGGGIMSKTIIVTCDDENDEEPGKDALGGLLSSRPSPAPPMSLLAPILKMMAARATARLQRQLQPKPSFRAFPPQPFLQPVSMSLNGPIGQQPFQGPFPVEGRTHFEGPSPFDRPGPMNRPMHMNRPNPFDGPSPFERPGPFGRQEQFDGPPPFPFKPNMNMGHAHGPIMVRGPISVPGNSISEHFGPPPPHAINEQGPLPGSFIPFNGERDAPFREDIPPPRQPLPSPEPLIRVIPARNMEAPEEPMNKNQPIKIIHGFPPQMPEALKQIVSHIMNRPGNKDMSDRQPIIKIKAIPDMRNGPEMDGPKSKLLLPMPVRAVKLQTRGARKLGSGEDRFDGPLFPIPRGAIPSGMTQPIVPEAAGRALDSPVALPSLSELPPLRFFPGKLLRIPVPIQARAITHMEMKQNPNELPIDNEAPFETEEPNVPEVERDEGPDFGPPRRHTVIRTPPQLSDNLSQESQPLPPIFGRFPPPPPPKFAREGRVGIIREINPDAELVKPAAEEAKPHHMIMVN